jgi:hypothetical protein
MNCVATRQAQPILAVPIALGMAGRAYLHLAPCSLLAWRLQLGRGAVSSGDHLGLIKCRNGRPPGLQKVRPPSPYLYNFLSRAKDRFDY